MRGITVVLCAVMLGACAPTSPAATEPSAAVPTTSQVDATTAPASTTLAPATTTSTTTTAPTTTTVPPPPRPSRPLEPPPKGRLVIHAVGDVGLSTTQHTAFLTEGYGHAWTGLGGLFTRDDLTIINLECDPSLRGVERDKKFAFRCALEGLPVAAASGVEVASMGNNHSGDFGSTALVDGRANVIEAGMVPVGAGKDLSEANLPAVFEIDGWTIAVVGFSGISGGEGWFAGGNSPGVAPASDGNLAASIAAADDLADIVIVTIHWGEEGLAQPTWLDRHRVDLMIEAGADAIVGHHSHRLQPFEVVDGVPVFWSLGNFVWPALGRQAQISGVAEIVVEPDGAITGRLIPAYIVSHGHPVLRGRPDPSLWVTPEPIE